MNMAFPDSRAFDTGDGAQTLRPLAWSELCARLVAAQDLRRHRQGQGQGQDNHAASAPGTPPDGLHGGSFHGAAAQMLDHHEGWQDFINPTSSIYRKDNQGKHVVSRETPLTECATRQADEN